MPSSDVLPDKATLLEIYRRAGRRSFLTGSCKGKGGPMHITHPETGVMVTTGVVGSSMPIANGLALASQIRGDQRVSVAYFGDGASNIGAGDKLGYAGHSRRWQRSRPHVAGRQSGR